MGWRLVTRQGVDMADGRPDIVSHWGPPLLAFKLPRRPRPGVYKAAHDPPLLERPFPLAQLWCHALQRWIELGSPYSISASLRSEIRPVYDDGYDVPFGPEVHSPFQDEVRARFAPEVVSRVSDQLYRPM